VTPRLVILSAPSGSGKTTIARRLEASRDDVEFSVSATTRTPRENEQNGVDYYFFARDEFERRRAAGAFVEWSEHFGALYGTLKDEVDRILRAGRHALLDIDVQGAAQVRDARADAVAVFVLPPSADALLERLARRSTESTEQLRRRLERADRELADARSFDHVVVNDDLEEAVAAVGAIIDRRLEAPAHDNEAYVAALRRELQARTTPPTTEPSQQ
jgi:guanylate kinase